MKIRDVISDHKPITILESATYEEAAKLLYENKISGAPVVDKDGVMLGLISEKDLFKSIHPSYEDFYKHPESQLDYEALEGKVKDLKNKNIKEFMARDVTTAHPDDPLLKIGALMLARHFHRIPVVEDGKLIGVVTRRRIYGNILKQHLGF